ncbi:coiled-coil domain-containing protein 69 [Anguilla rostrata]|uniref:coiled-coil domain-containing protein 69 n=1 Tax=Anguilla rostrata TaxID=7938 RepID=UPI0030D246A4
MGCCSSSVCSGVFRKKTKNEGKKGKQDCKEINSLQDGSSKVPLEELGPSLEKLHEQYEQQFRALQQALKAAGTKEREKLLQTHSQQLSRLLWDITEKVKADTTADLNMVYEKKLMTNTEEHQIRTEELKKAHDQEKKSLREDFEAGQASLQAKVDELTADLKLFNELKRSVEESSLKRDLQRNIQAQGSPGAFWEQELESLLFVIEMKSKKLQDQWRKLQQAEVLVEKNSTMEDQVKHVLQQNEDLEARISSHQTLIQRLSKEQQSLQEALRKEALLIQKLSQEKEELLYRLLQQEPGLALRPSPIAPQLTPS